jgi:hypothetical protein
MLSRENMTFDDVAANTNALIRLLQRRSSPTRIGDCIDTVSDIRGFAA